MIVHRQKIFFGPSFENLTKEQQLSFLNKQRERAAKEVFGDSKRANEISDAALESWRNSRKSVAEDIATNIRSNRSRINQFYNGNVGTDSKEGLQQLRNKTLAIQHLEQNGVSEKTINEVIKKHGLQGSDAENLKGLLNKKGWAAGQYERAVKEGWGDLKNFNPETVEGRFNLLRHDQFNTHNLVGEIHHVNRGKMTSTEFLEQINKHENNLQNEINSANSNLLNKVKSQSTNNQNLRCKQVLGILEKEKKAEAARIAAERAERAAAAMEKVDVGAVESLAAEKSSANKVNGTLAEATKAGGSLKKYGKYGAVGLGAAGLLGGAYYLGTRNK